MLQHVDVVFFERSQMEQLRALYRAAWTATYGPTLGAEFLAALLLSLDDPELKSMMPQRDERIAVALKGSKLIGATTFAERGGFIYVWGMYVLPNEQRNGIGTKLMSFVADHAKSTKGIGLNVLPTSPNAVSFYKKMGFKEYAIEPIELAPGYTVQSTVMTKRLKP